MAQAASGGRWSGCGEAAGFGELEKRCRGVEKGALGESGSLIRTGSRAAGATQANLCREVQERYSKVLRRGTGTGTGTGT